MERRLLRGRVLSRCRRGIALLIVCCGAISVVAVSASGFPARSARTCPTAELLGIRGSGEHSGLGRTLSSLTSELRKRVPGAHSEAINYPAVDVNPLNPKYNSDYIDSVTRGTDALEARIVAFANGACATRSRLFLVGYSQGAEVVDDVLATLPSRLSRLVDGVVLFGDPRFNSAQELPVDVGTFNHSLDGVAPYQFHPPTGTFGTLVSYTAAEAPVIRSYCANHDQICNYSSPAALAGCAVSCAHFHYMQLRVTTGGRAPTYTQAGAAFLVSRLHSPLAPSPSGYRWACKPGENFSIGPGYFVTHSPWRIAMSHKTQLAIWRALPDGEFSTPHGGSSVPDTLCRVAASVVDDALVSWGETTTNDIVLPNEQVKGYVPGPRLGRFPCSGTTQHPTHTNFEITHESCVDRSGLFGFVGVKFVISGSP
jgi:hypothetical protein